MLTAGVHRDTADPEGAELPLPLEVQLLTEPGDLCKLSLGIKRDSMTSGIVTMSFSRPQETMRIMPTQRHTSPRAWHTVS